MIVSLVVFVQLARPNAMLRALLRLDAEKVRRWLYKDGTPASEQEDASRLLASLTTLLRGSPDHLRYEQIFGLMHRVVEAGEDKNAEAAQRRVEEAQQLASSDSGNLLTSLSAAVIIDRTTAGATTAPADSIARFRSIQEIIEKNGGAKFAKTYRREDARLWDVALVPFISRPDTRQSLAFHFAEETSPSSADQYRGLLETATYVLELSRELLAANHSAEAKTCEQWVAQCAMGILDTDVDTPRQLLCVRMLRDIMGADSSAGASLQKLLVDFHGQSSAAPIDLADQTIFKSQKPALYPSAYRTAFASLIVAVLFVSVAAGCVAMFIVTGLVAIVTHVRKRDVDTTSREQPLAWYSKSALLLSPSALASAFVVMRLSQHSLYSQVWLIAVVAATMAFGMAGCATIAGLHQRKGMGRISNRLILVCIVAILPCIGLILSPYALTSLCRRLDLSLSALFILVPILIAIIVACGVMSRARFRTLAATALLAWLVNAAAAVVVLEIHRGFDKQHQDLIVANQSDEMSVRLGSNWKEQYLTPVKKSLGQIMP